MSHIPLRSALLASLALATSACASQRVDEPRQLEPERRSDLITFEEIEGRDWASAYEMILALRGAWLHDRGEDTIVGERTEIRVILDGMRIGGVAQLRSTSVLGIEYVQYFRPIEAASRWGVGFGKGAIYISTRPR